MIRLDPYESLGLYCTLTRKAFLAGLEKKLKGTGVSPTQFIALVQLVGLGSITQSKLAVILLVKPPTAVQLVNRMERNGWVTRQTDSKDGRVKRLVPTKKAIEIFGKVSHVGRELMDEAYWGIHPSEIETVKRVLDRVRKNLGA